MDMGWDFTKAIEKPTWHAELIENLPELRIKGVLLDRINSSNKISSLMSESKMIS